MPRSDVEAGRGPRDANGVAAPLLDVPEGTVDAPDAAHTVSYKVMAEQFSWLGWAAFGGPSAHVSLFQKVMPTLTGCNRVSQRRREAACGCTALQMGCCGVL